MLQKRTKMSREKKEEKKTAKLKKSEEVDIEKKLEKYKNLDE